jgi:uncharacterized protein (DUF983 family)
MPEPEPVRWEPDRATPRPLDRPGWPEPPMLTAFLRGAAGHCPACGRAPLFAGWLRVRPTCAVCDVPLGAARADDAPPYFTIFIVGHVIIGLMMFTDRAYAPPLWLSAAIFLPLTLFLALGLLRPVKGATVGLMLKLGLFKPADDDA